MQDWESSMTCFLPAPPLPSHFTPSHSLRRAHHPRRHGAGGAGKRLHVPPSALLQPPATPFAPFLPPIASEIADPTARSMLRSLSLTPLPTSLSPETITTSHLSQSHHTKRPALVFLHGFDSNLLEFRRLHSVLSPSPPATLHYVDILGWGLTARPTNISYGPTAKREHLRAFLDAVEPGRRVILVGASLGGAIAVDFALMYPDRVAKILLIDGQVYMDRPKVPIPRFLAHVGADVLRSRWLRNLAVDMTYVSDEFKCEDVLRIVGLHCAMDGWKSAMVDFIMGEGYCLSKRVADVREKSFVVWGEHDRVLPKGDLQKFQRDGFPVVVAPGCGHSPHIEDPVFVAEHIRKIVHSC